MVRIGLLGCGRIGRVHADGRAALVLAEAALQSLRTGNAVTVSTIDPDLVGV